MGGIAAQSTFEGNAGAGAVFPDGGTKVGSLSGGLKRSERTTISTSHQGVRFSKKAYWHRSI